MKKISILIVTILLAFMLISCKKNDKLNDEPYNEYYTFLPYYSYLKNDNPVITITVKDFGVMEAHLFPRVAPNTVNNFIDYVTNKLYNGSEFHRIIKNFMIQGGAVENTNKPIEGEFSSNDFNNPLNHLRGVLSMARTNIANSATSQFFIIHEQSQWLDGEYATFGGLIEGFEVLDQIANVITVWPDAPLEKVVIESITIELNGYKPKKVVYA